MKKLLLASVLIMSMACWAQTSSSSSSTQTSSAKAGTTANDTSEHTMTGCIVARNGEFFLRTRGRRGPIELLSSDDLTAHNGHEVTVTGTWANKETVAEHEKNEEQNQSSAQKNAHERRERGERHFQVSKLEMVADHCGPANKTSGATGSSSSGSAPK
jgi:hypothetical protein